MYLQYKNNLKKLDVICKKVKDSILEIPEAILKINDVNLEMLFKPSVIIDHSAQKITTGYSITKSVACAHLYIDKAKAITLARSGNAVIWVTDRIYNDDIAVLKYFSGVLTIKEDPTSHAAIIMRVLDIPCLTFVKDLSITKNQLIHASFGLLQDGMLVTLDGFNSILFKGFLKIHTPSERSKNIFLDIIMGWVKMLTKIEVHGNADTIDEATYAIAMGAQGLDPRTEHMFFEPDCLNLFRQLILSKRLNQEQQSKIIQAIYQKQKQDFISLYRTAKNYPVKIRLLDPPLHEFLAVDQLDLHKLASDIHCSLEELMQMLDDFKETNPMMGNRGVRLLLTNPLILELQVRAIFEASIVSSLGEPITPHIIIPMVMCEGEIKKVKEILDNICKEISVQKNISLSYHLGIMSETPSACIMAHTIAPYIDFVSFGSNDLTAQTLALSRGDVYNKFLDYYLTNNIIAFDPFAQLDHAVCHLMQMTVSQLRKQNHYIHIGICGEQGSEKRTVNFCHEIGLDVISCFPARIPVVKLYAAQASIKANQKQEDNSINTFYQL